MCHVQLTQRAGHPGLGWPHAGPARWSTSHRRDVAVCCQVFEKDVASVPIAKVLEQHLEDLSARVRIRAGVSL